MNLLDLFIKIGVDDKASSKIDGIASKVTGTLGNAAGLAAKGVAAGVAAVTAATGAITKSSLDAYGAYEQNVGGIQKLFGNMGKSLDEYAELTGNAVDAVAEKWGVLEQSQNMVLQNAANAYKTAGMSANQYMEQVTGFSAALITSLGNDTVAAANYAEMAMVDMADNANTFGTDMESIQWAYQGFAKQNYTMLDNLKLGYGGTKEEMQRLISDASKMTDVQKKLGVTVDESSLSFDNIVAAIHVMQESMQIGGTTAREAATTIEGSVNMMKAAWENWLTGLGDSDADMAQLTDNLVESFETAAENVVPRVAIILGTLLGSVPGIVAEVGPVAAQALQDTFMTAAQTFHDILPQEAQSALDGAIETFQSSGLADAVGNALSGIAEFGAKAADGISQLAESFDETSAMEAAATVIDTVAGFIGHLADQAGEYLMPVLEAAGEAMSAFFQAVADAQVWLEPLATFLGDVLVAALEIVAAAFTFAVDAVTLLVNAVTEFVNFLMGVPASVQSFVDQVGAFFGQLPGLIGGFLAGVMASIGAWVAGIVAQAVQAGSQFLSSVGSFFGQLPGQVGGFLSSVIGAVGGWVSSMGGKAAEAASTFGSNLISGLMGIVGQAQSAGQAIIQGVIDGITGMIGAAGSAIEGVLSTIASYLPHSPAKRGPFSGRGWTPYSGRAIVHGLAEGIAELADEPADAMASVMEGISATQAVADAATVTVKGSGGMAEGESAVIRWLAENLPAIIAEFTPVMGESEFGRKARKAVAYA
ncbi:phage tail protein [Slackia isoflavoniconvertens]|uniref:phage tail protein n=1 Tax=Slackia isoflavoniconvertens TaxID=572010 RepID=UPI003AF14A89